MQTNDIVKLGIDRNFIRECERQGIINPNRSDGKMIVDENYRRREYSQLEFETIWGSYMLRKIGFSFAEIKQWLNGKNINFRNRINSSIEKFEQQIEELKSMIDFMKYIRGMNTFPNVPTELNEVSNFNNFLQQHMRNIDPEKTKLEVLEDIHRMLELSKIPSDQITLKQKLELRGLEKKHEKLTYFFMKDKSNTSVIQYAKEAAGYFELFGNLLLKNNKDITHSEIQNLIWEIYNKFKMIIDKPNLKPFEFAWIMCNFFSEDSDMMEYMINEMGRENVELFCNSALEFARIEDAETYNSMINKFYNFI